MTPERTWKATPEATWETTPDAIPEATWEAAPDATSPGAIVGLFADVHGAHAALNAALVRCRTEGVTTIALLGDLIDRVEQADGCTDALAGWDVIGVYGNHEREIALAAAKRDLGLRPDTVRLLSGLRERVFIGDACLLHEGGEWENANAATRLFRPPEWDEDATDEDTIAVARARVTFAGHTHYRQVRDERGMVDIARGTLALRPHRRYLINPGALSADQFAIWDRVTDRIRFCQVASGGRNV